MLRRSPGFPPWPVLPLCAALCGCGQEQGVTYPEFDAPELKHGREIWLANCQPCHGTGLAGAPRLGNREAWAPRIQQGIEVLFSHALNGFAGKTGTEMPARGGNPQLEDVAVQAAVRYMVQASQ
jgi:cytochrome c5